MDVRTMMRLFSPARLVLTLSLFSHRGFAIRSTPKSISSSAFLSMNANDGPGASILAKRQKFTPTSIKVYYWDMSFWRADTMRAALYLQGIPFENITDKEHMNALKADGKCPFGAFPVMEIDGQILSQTQACATYVGKLGGMYPSNDDIFAQAKCDEIINGCTDVTNTISASFRVEDKKEAREKLIDPKVGRLYLHLNGLNSIVCMDGTEFACAGKLTVADLAVWRLVNWFHGGRIDHIDTDWIMSSFANLKKIYDNVEKNEKIRAFKKEFYPDKK